MSFFGDHTLSVEQILKVTEHSDKLTQSLKHLQSIEYHACISGAIAGIAWLSSWVLPTVSIGMLSSLYAGVGLGLRYRARLDVQTHREQALAIYKECTTGHSDKIYYALREPAVQALLEALAPICSQKDLMCWDESHKLAGVGVLGSPLPEKMTSTMTAIEKNLYAKTWENFWYGGEALSSQTLTAWFETGKKEVAEKAASEAEKLLIKKFS